MALSAREAKRQKTRFLAELAREQKKKDRARVRELSETVKRLKREQREAIRRVRALCKERRGGLRRRAKTIRAAHREAARAEVKALRAAARERCEARKKAVLAAGGTREQAARAKLAEEKKFVRDFWRRESGDKRRTQKRSTARERSRESDEEVSNNLPAELQGVWRRVARDFKDSPRKSRTEAFLQWAEENPAEVVGLQEAAGELVLARMIAEAEAERDDLSKRTRRRYDRGVLEAVPF